MSGSGVVAGPWVLLLVVAAFAVPLLLNLGATPRSTAGSITTLQGRAVVVLDVPDPSPLKAGGIDVYRWENDGGAPPERETVSAGERGPGRREAHLGNV